MYIGSVIEVDSYLQVRDYRNIDDFLPIDSAETPPQATVARFDYLDMIFADASTKNPPWHPSVKPLCRLVNMCQQSGKCLFATNLAAMAMSYMIATNGAFIHAINGGGKGEVFIDWSKIHTKEGDVLDISTGDVYQYSTLDNDWIPVMNVGVHRSGLSHIRDSYRVPTIVRDVVVKPSFGELGCHKTKKHVQHWIFDQMFQNNFLIGVERTWDLHSPRRNQVISILAESKAGLELIEYGHMIGANFDVTPKYPHSVQMLRNFIQHKTQLMKKYDRLEFVSQRLYQTACSEGLQINAGMMGIYKQKRAELANQDDSSSDDGQEYVTTKTSSNNQKKPPKPDRPSSNGSLDIQLIQKSTMELSRSLRSSMPQEHDTVANLLDPDYVRKAHREFQYFNGGGTASLSYRSLQNGSEDSVPYRTAYHPSQATPPRSRADGQLSSTSSPRRPVFHIKVPESSDSSERLHGGSLTDRSSYTPSMKASDIQPLSARSFGRPPRLNLSNQSAEHRNSLISADRNEQALSERGPLSAPSRLTSIQANDLKNSFSPSPNLSRRPILSLQSSVYAGDPDRRIHINLTSKPYTAYKKFEKMAVASEDGNSIHSKEPYEEPGRRQKVEEMERKKKWLGNDFVAGSSPTRISASQSFASGGPTSRGTSPTVKVIADQKTRIHAPLSSAPRKFSAVSIDSSIEEERQRSAAKIPVPASSATVVRV
eukprot:TRINITY_DN7138_c0_g2_i3.p1 TRINITY_DN7138_c0_g2~~TRINITY_DN7138_c0_g2_i3.p1  ORF type:complete len:709 (+),score=127.36 TRINITY_DN7138_c0_g2_i3:87-2213(+)